MKRDVPKFTAKLAGFAASLLVSLPLLAQMPVQPPPLVSGEVFSRQAQQIIVPAVSRGQTLISSMVPEGNFVETGTLIVEFDGTEAARQLEQQREVTRTEQARTDRDLARLAKELEQARYQLKQAEVDLELATLKADLPEGIIGAIEHAENQLAFEEATNALEDARKQFGDSQKSLQDRQKQDELDRTRIALQETWWAEMLENMTVYAEQSGYVIYGNHPWTRAKFQEGDNVRTSFQVAQVADTADLAVKVWINGVDRPRIAEGDKVEIRFDALAERRWTGHIQSISASGSKRQEWGEANYFEGIAVLDEGGDGELLPGMSALVEVLPSQESGPRAETGP